MERNPINTRIKISKEDALELLYKTDSLESSNNRCFDEYGNYSYPTDMVVDTPNTAIGTPLGLSLIKQHNL